MAVALSLRDNSTAGNLTSADVSNGILYSSADQSNSPGGSLIYKGADIIVRYNDFQASGGVTLSAVIEGKDNAGKYYPVGYQFNELWQTGKELFHTLDVNPDSNWADAGSPNAIFPGELIGYVHHQQITLPETWRVCIRINEPSGSTFTSVELDISAELMNKEA